MRVGRGGRTESPAPTGWDVEDAVPYTLRHCEEYPKGTCFAARSDAAIRSPQHKETDFRAGDMGGQSRSTLQRDGFPRQSADWLGMTGNGTSGTPSPTGWDVEDAVPYGAQFTPLF